MDNPPLGGGLESRAGRLGAPASAVHSPTAPIQTLLDLQILLGNPSGANAANPKNFLIQRTQYALAYSRDEGIPRWTSWHLNASSLGTVRRTGNYLVDSSLPIGWNRIDSHEYSRTGYNRGHMCPSEQRTRTLPDNLAVFLMTNMIPQAPGNDEGPWALLESYTRDLALQGFDLFLACGGDGSLGTLNGLNRVTIPAHTWYVIVVSRTPITNASQVDGNVRVITVRMPNDSSIATSRWQDFRLSVAEVEKATGFTFFSQVSPTIAKVLKSRVDNQ